MTQREKEIQKFGFKQDSEDSYITNKCKKVINHYLKSVNMILNAIWICIFFQILYIIHFFYLRITTRLDNVVIKVYELLI